MAYYIGMKGNRVVVVNEKGTEAAYHAIGRVLGIDAADTGNIDLDAFAEIPRLAAGGFKELFEDRLG